MSKYLTLLSIIVIIISCTSQKKEIGLLGIWEFHEDHHTKVVLIFDEDSVITESFGGDHRTNSNWTVDSSKVYFSNIKLLDTILADVEYDYTINATKDSLWIKVAKGNGTDYSLLKKVTINLFSDRN